MAQPTVSLGRSKFLVLTIVARAVHTKTLAWLDLNVVIDYSDEIDALQALCPRVRKCTYDGNPN